VAKARRGAASSSRGCHHGESDLHQRGHGVATSHDRTADHHATAAAAAVHSDLVHHAVVGLHVLEAATSDAIVVAAIDCVLVHAAVNHHGQSCVVVSGFVHVHAAVILHD